MLDSGQICRLKFPAPPLTSLLMIMLHCERLTGRHFLTLTVLASDEPAGTGSASHPSASSESLLTQMAARQTVKIDTAVGGDGWECKDEI